MKKNWSIFQDPDGIDHGSCPRVLGTHSSDVGIVRPRPLQRARLIHLTVSRGDHQRLCPVLQTRVNIS